MRSALCLLLASQPPATAPVAAPPAETTEVSPADDAAKPAPPAEAQLLEAAPPEAAPPEAAPPEAAPPETAPATVVTPSAVPKSGVEGPQPASGPSSSPAVKDRLGCDGSKTCRQLTRLGIALQVLGAGSIVTGAILLSRDDKILSDEPAYMTSTKPPGLVATTLGSGILVTGVLMLIAAHKGVYKQRDGVARLPLQQSMHAHTRGFQ